MDLTFLPPRIYNALSKCNIDSILEIRLRCGFAVKINNNGRYYYLSDEGISLLNQFSIICGQDDIDFIIKNVTEHSIYAFSDRIKNGYLTTKDGIRIGVAGHCVFDNEKIMAIKNFSSLNIRIPNEQNGCADKLFEYVYNKKFYNTLIISPPLYGKTTLLKDLAKKISDLNLVSVLVIDERGEFSKIRHENIDIISYSDKLYAFKCGIRSLAPSVVITDELEDDESDWNCVKQACNSGIKIIASCHASCLNEVVSKQHYMKNLFERFVVLKTGGKAGIIDKVYDRGYVEL